jgi:hypothetical protein
MKIIENISLYDFISRMNDYTDRHGYSPVGMKLIYEFLESKAGDSADKELGYTKRLAKVRQELKDCLLENEEADGRCICPNRKFGFTSNLKRGYSSVKSRQRTAQTGNGKRRRPLEIHGVKAVTR